MYVKLDDETREALHRLAEDQRRRPQDQAAFLLRNYFEAARVLGTLERRDPPVSLVQDE